MKKLFYTITIAIVFAACGPDQNTILYNKVMDIHDEMMPKMEELYNRKKELQAQLTADSTMAEDKRSRIEAKITRIDEADKLMMDWMHAFTPPDKNADEEKTRAYLESELEKVTKMKEAMLDALK